MASAVTGGGMLATVFVLAYVAWLLSELAGSTILPRLRGGGRRETSRSDRGSRLTIFLAVFGSIAAVYGFVGQGFATLPVAVVYLGLGMMFAGIGIRQWSIAVLGRYFSTSVRAVEGHRIVTQGPYRILRHPSYTGALVTVLGIGFAGGSWEGIFVALVLSSVAYGYRIHVEEQFLVEQFGAEYLEYQKRTKRVIPYLW